MMAERWTTTREGVVLLPEDRVVATRSSRVSSSSRSSDTSSTTRRRLPAVLEGWYSSRSDGRWFGGEVGRREDVDVRPYHYRSRSSI